MFIFWGGQLVRFLGMALLSLGLMVSAAPTLAEPPLVTLEPDNPHAPIVAIEYLLVDQPMSAEQVAAPPYASQWRPYTEAGVPLDEINRDTRFWLRFNVHNANAASETWWLVPRWSQLLWTKASTHDRVTGQWWHGRTLGELVPFDERYVEHRYPIFPLQLQSDHTTTVYMALQSTTLVDIPLGLWQPDAFLAQDQSEVILLGVFFGSLAIMLLYNLSLYTILRDPTYLTYSCMVATVIFYELSLTGMGYYYVWGHNTWWVLHSLPLFASLSFLFATLFFRHFLKLPQHGGWLLAINNALVVLWSVVSVASVASFSFDLWLGVLIHGSSLISCILGSVIGIVLWYRGERAAKVYVCATAFLILGTIVFGLALGGTLPLNIFTRYSQMGGFVIELVLFSLALAYRINIERQQREAAQAELLTLTKRISTERNQRLRAQDETLSVQIQLNEQLEQRVTERTEQLELALEKLEQANTELTRLSVTDPLTHVANRRYFDQMLVDECKRAHRNGHPLAVILVDIDYFKSINDNYGHTIGDECIALIAKTLKAVVNRPGDLLARYGGEEFAYILPGLDESSALRFASKCRLAVDGLVFEHGDERLPLTVSAGVAAWVPESEKGYQELVDGADSALYRAKKAGRNCVVATQSTGSVVQL